MAKKQTNPSVNQAAASKVDAIKDLIFGQQIQEYEAKFDKLNNRIIELEKKLTKTSDGGKKDLEKSKEKITEEIKNISIQLQKTNAELSANFEKESTAIKKELNVSKQTFQESFKTNKKELKSILNAEKKELNVSLSQAKTELKENIEATKSEFLEAKITLSKKLNETKNNLEKSLVNIDTKTNKVIAKNKETVLVKLSDQKTAMHSALKEQAKQTKNNFNEIEKDKISKSDLGLLLINMGEELKAKKTS